ncbi:S41 family peptidase [Lentisphaerota bacterium WC36G]|nr:S41 family peptidase [Lentisphaerae bacterium WC36]
MKKLMSSIVIGVFLSLNIFANQKLTTDDKNDIILSELNKQQMVEDFDFLIKIFKESYPKFDIAEKVYGIDMVKILESYKKRITGNETPEEFIDLLIKATQQCKADHFGIAPVSVYCSDEGKKYRFWFDGLVKNDDYIITQKYLKEHYKKRNKQPRVHLPLFYKNKNLYLMFDIINDGKKYPANLKLVSYNGKTTLELLKQYQSKFSKYDSVNKLFYDDRSFITKIVDKDSDSLILIFEDENGEKHQYDLSKKCAYPKELLSKMQVASKLNKKSVKYIKKDKILIIRIPTMYPKYIDFYKQNIIKEAANKKINAIILDIRNNSGGSDKVWNNILKNIIAEPINLKTTLAYRKGGLVEIYLKNRFGKDWPSKFELQKIPYLKNIEYRVYDEDIKIEPSQKSLNFTGPIFILCQNNYSSASSLAILAKASPRFITIGPKNNIDVGVGINPMIFSLPNSRIIMTFGCDTDISYCKTTKDTMHLYTNVEISGSNYLLEYYNALDKAPKSFDNNQKVEWLYNQLSEIDPFYKKALELIK